MSILTRTSPFVQIKDGNQEPPIVIAHGLSGLVQFEELAKHIRTDHPIYGIQARGIDDAEEPLDRVEDMAQLYLDALDEQDPGDGYILIGYSFGGLVALEMAQRLVDRGKDIKLLSLLDSYPHPRFLPARDRLRLFAKRMKGHAEQMSQLPYSESLAYFAKGFKRRLHLPGAGHESQRSPERMALSFEEASLRRVNQKCYLAYSKYLPKFYPGKIRFVTTEIKSFFPTNPVRVWGKLVSKLEVEIIPGDHLNIVTTEFRALAAVLTRYIEEATAGQV